MSNSKNRNNFNKNRTEKEVLYGRNACFGCLDGFKNNTKTRDIFNIYLLQSKFDEYYKKIPSELKQIHRSPLRHQIMLFLRYEQLAYLIFCLLLLLMHLS